MTIAVFTFSLLGAMALGMPIAFALIICGIALMSTINMFDSQIVGGKRHDLASLGRRRANATYFEAHGVDETTGLSYGMDMTPLMTDANLQPAEFVGQFVQRFAADVQDRVNRLS